LWHLSFTRTDYAAFKDGVVVKVEVRGHDGEIAVAPLLPNFCDFLM